MMHILLIEDNPQMAERLRILLDQKDFSYHITRIRTLQELKTFMGGRSKVDVVISALRMARFSGLSVLQYLRGHSPLLPVIIISGGTHNGMRKEIILNGAYDYILHNSLEKLIPSLQGANDHLKYINDRVAQEEIFDWLCQQLENVNFPVSQVSSMLSLYEINNDPLEPEGSSTLQRIHELQLAVANLNNSLKKAVTYHPEPELFKPSQLVDDVQQELEQRKNGGKFRLRLEDECGPLRTGREKIRDILVILIAHLNNLNHEESSNILDLYFEREGNWIRIIISDKKAKGEASGNMENKGWLRVQSEEKLYGPNLFLAGFLARLTNAGLCRIVAGHGTIAYQIEMKEEPSA